MDSSSVTPFQRFIAKLDSSGRQFESFTKWYLQNDPEWSTQVAKIWLWDEWPGRWGPDCGIDLVFEDKNGDRWAVQAKQYATSTSIRKTDVDSFLSESNRSTFQRRLLIATTDRIGRNAKQACEGQEKPVVLHLAWDFEHAELRYPSSFADLTSAKPKPKPEPRPYQKRAIEDAVNGFGQADRGQLIMACGTGKTFVSLWIKERLQAETALVLLPSLNLLAQTLREWTAAANEPFEVLCVCSDETVGRRGSDEAVSSVSDVAFPVHSDPTSIARFLRGSGRRVIFSTYQSSPLVAVAQRRRGARDFDLVVADEAHRCAGSTDTAFATVLDDSLIRAKKRLFATATPRTYSTSVKRSADERGIEIVGMDDESIFGPPLHTLSFGAAIDHDPPLLTDYRVVIIGVDDAMIAEWIENRELLSLESGEAVDAESLAAQIGLLKAMRDYDIHRAITFHGRVKRAKEFSEDIKTTLRLLSEEHRPAGELWADYVQGEMPTDQRRRKLTQLKTLDGADRGLLSNARCLSEGIDVPALDGVAFIDPRRSQVDIVQAVGRAIRLSEGKTAGTIILPVFIEAGENAEASIESSRFKPVWDVLNALRSHDESLGYELDQIRTELGKQPGSKTNFCGLSKIVVDLPLALDESFAESLRTILVERTTASWEFWYGHLVAYKVKYGDCNVPQRWAENQQLASWVNTQRTFGNQGRLSAERRAKLDHEGFDWKPLDTIWFGQFDLWKKGDASEDNRKWVYKQRHEWRCGKLQSDRKALLSQAGFEFSPRSRKDEQWLRRLKQFHQFKIKFGHANVPVHAAVEGFEGLGQWVNRQRTLKRGLGNRQFPAWKVQALEEAGFVWDLRRAIWDEHFAELKAFLSKHSLGDLSRRSNRTLHEWVIRQRATKDRLSHDQIQLLDELGIDWETKREQRWEERYSELKAFLRANGNIDVGKKENPTLYNWITNMRGRIRRGELDSERIDRLKELGIEA